VASVKLLLLTFWGTIAAIIVGGVLLAVLR
jgi:hypothetical protein